jgi:hypothetical protein
VFEVETIDDLLINFVAGRDAEKTMTSPAIFQNLACTFLFTNIATFYQPFSLFAKILVLLNFKVKP